MTSRPEKIVPSSKRRKRDLSNDALSKIRPYSVFPLECGGDLFLMMAKIEPFFSRLKKEFVSTLPKNTQLPKFGKACVSEIPYIEYFIGRCLICKHRSEIWDRPLLGEFKRDVRAFKKIAVNTPGLIEDASQVLIEKYSHLHVLSQEYLRWIILFKGNFLFKVDKHSHQKGKSKKDIGKELQKKVIEYANNILDNFPEVENQGAKEDIVAAWLTEELRKLWHSAGYDTAEKKYHTEFIGHFWKIADLVGAKINPTQYRDAQIRIMLCDNYRPQQYRRNFKKISPKTYLGQSIWDIITDRLHNAGRISAMRRGDFLKYLGHEILFNIRYLAHIYMGFSSPWR